MEFTDDALEAIADQAIHRGTGARGLQAFGRSPAAGDATSRARRCRQSGGHQGAVQDSVLPTIVPRKPSRSERRDRRVTRRLHVGHRCGSAATGGALDLLVSLADVRDGLGPLSVDIPPVDPIGSQASIGFVMAVGGISQLDRLAPWWTDRPSGRW